MICYPSRSQFFSATTLATRKLRASPGELLTVEIRIFVVGRHRTSTKPLAILLRRGANLRLLTGEGGPMAYFVHRRACRTLWRVLLQRSKLTSSSVRRLELAFRLRALG